MCQIGARRDRTHYYRFRSIERKIYTVCVFCGQRAYGYGGMKLPCPALQPGRGNWFTEIERPATHLEYDRRAIELGVQRVPPNVHRSH